MQGTLPVGEEGGMPPTARGALIQQAQDRMRQMLQERQMMQERQMQMQQPQMAPPGGMPPAPAASPGVDPQQQMMQEMQMKRQQQMQAAPQQGNMMDQQARWAEVINRLKQAQQGAMQQQVPGMM